MAEKYMVWGMGDLGIRGLGDCIPQTRCYLNVVLSKCGVVVLVLTIGVVLASCKNRNLVLTYLA